METVAAVFRTTETAREAYGELRRAGFSPDDINLLSPGSSEQAIHSVPTSDTEQSGTIGGAIGGVVGGALGMAGGFELGDCRYGADPGCRAGACCRTGRSRATGRGRSDRRRSAGFQGGYPKYPRASCR